MRIVVITGMSGSGKSTAVRALEDEGFYCIDNLPVRLFRQFVELIEKSGERFRGIVLVTDIRGRELSSGIIDSFRELARWAGAGLAALGRGFRSPRAAVDAQRVPQVPYGAGRQAARAGASAMIDVSDGLLADLGHIVDASGVSIDLESARFTLAEPVKAVAAAINADPLGFVLAGGEDHALAATFEAGTVPGDWDVVGRVIDADPQAGSQVLVDGRPWEGQSGWTHFRGKR